MRRLVLLLVAALLPLSFAAAPAVADEAARAAALAQAVKTRKVKNVKFENASLDDLLKWLKVATSFNYVVKRDVLQKANVEIDSVKATLVLDDVTIATILDLVLEPHGLVWACEGNIVFVTTKADALGKPVFAIYPISHITWQKVDFHGPRIDLTPSDYKPEEDPEEVPVEDDPLTNPDYVVELVKQMVDEPWDTEGWSLKATKTILTCRAPRPVQAEVAKAISVIAALK